MVKSTRPAPPLSSTTPYRPAAIRPHPAKSLRRPLRLIDLPYLSMEPQPTRLQYSPSPHSCGPSDGTPTGNLLPNRAEHPSGSHVDDDEDGEDDGYELQDFDNGRQRLQQHWIQVGGKVVIPETWGREQHLQDWVSFGLVEDALRPAGLAFARTALIAECQARGDAAAASRASAEGGSSAPLINRSADVEVS